MGGFALQKKSSPSGSNPAYFPCDSNWGWHGEWFYIKNQVEALLSPFTKRRLEGWKSWSWGPSSRQNKLEVIEAELQNLVQHNLDGLWVFHTFLRCRVAPLAERRWPMWNYFGPTDLDCASSEELAKDEFWS